MKLPPEEEKGRADGSKEGEKVISWGGECSSRSQEQRNTTSRISPSPWVFTVSSNVD